MARQHYIFHAHMVIQVGNPLFTNTLHSYKYLFSDLVFFSCTYEYVETVSFLLQYDGIDIDIGCTPISLNINRSNEIDGDDNEQNDRQSPLHLAAQAGHIDVVRLLLIHGFMAKLEQADVYGFTCLHTACEEGHDTVVGLLLDKGGSIIAVDNDGRTPLHHACARGHEMVVKLLVQHGAHVDTPSESMITPLMRAAGGGHVSVVQILLARGANVNCRDEGGKTPLHWAVEPSGMFTEHKGIEQIVLLVHELLAAGAKARIRDESMSKNRPSDVLIASGMIRGVELLDLLMVAEQQEEMREHDSEEESNDENDDDDEEEGNEEDDNDKVDDDK